MLIFKFMTLLLFEIDWPLFVILPFYARLELFTFPLLFKKFSLLLKLNGFKFTVIGTFLFPGPCPNIEGVCAFFEPFIFIGIGPAAEKSNGFLSCKE